MIKGKLRTESAVGGELHGANSSSAGLSFGLGLRVSIAVAAILMMLAFPASAAAVEVGTMDRLDVQVDTLALELTELPSQLRDEDSRAGALEVIRSQGADGYGWMATLWVQLLAVAEKGGGEAGALAAQAVLVSLDEDPRAAVDLIEEGLEELAQEEHPALLALGARLLDPEDPTRAAELRRRLLAVDPEAPEVPESRLRLARHLFEGSEPEGREEAVELLEALIVRGPNHPLAPEARRLLSTIRRDG